MNVLVDESEAPLSLLGDQRSEYANGANERDSILSYFIGKSCITCSTKIHVTWGALLAHITRQKKDNFSSLNRLNPPEAIVLRHLSGLGSPS
jgi:hypothetical protein